jgi:glycosyltransferase involved in cell wall biosynthesis
MLFSILTPSYQAGSFLRDALASVAEQGWDDVEHIVVDGQSSDGTLELLQSWPHPLTYVSEADRGQSHALNKALQLAQGEWIGWLNADDFYLPGALSKVAQAIASNPDADVVSGDCCFVDGKGAYLRLVPEHEMSGTVLRWYGCAIHSCATFVRRDLLVQQGFDETCREVMDWELYLGLLRRGADFAYLPSMLSAFRVHPGQVSATASGLRGAEATRVRDRYGIPSAPWAVRALRAVGRAEHITRKAAGGAFVREFRMRRGLRGTDMRWFHEGGECQAQSPQQA